MIDLKNHYGFTREPFGKNLAPGHAAPAHSARRGRRPDQLVHQRTRAGSDHRRGRRREDRRRPCRHRRPRPDPPHPHLPGQPHHRSARDLPSHRHRPRLPSPASTKTPPCSPRPPTLLAAEHAERGRTPVLLVFDEAHLLDHDHSSRPGAQERGDGRRQAAGILLIGRPTLRRMLRLGVLAALEQRIAWARLARHDRRADRGVDHHHLKLAGRTNPLFSDDAVT